MDDRDSNSIIELQRIFHSVNQLLVLGRGPSAFEMWSLSLSRKNVVVTSPTYINRDVFDGDPLAVLIGTPVVDLKGIADRYHATPPARRPVLLYTYLSIIPPLDFSGFDLPEPISITPLLYDRGLFTTSDDRIYPTSGTFLVMMGVGLEKEVAVAGIDLYDHHSKRTYASDGQDDTDFQWPPYHSLECEQRHLRRALKHATRPIHLSPELLARLE